MIMDLQLTHLTGNLGVEISSIDLSHELEPSIQKSIHELWMERELLVFRNQNLTEEQFIRFCNGFGKLAKNYFFFDKESKETSPIGKVIKEKGDKMNSGGIWHHDQGYYEEPVKGIMLYSVELPSKGGDTMFTSSTLAYEKLSPAMKNIVKSLNVVHSTQLMLNKKNELKALEKEKSVVSKVMDSMPLETAIHPAVCVNELTGKPFLYVNRTTTLQFEGMSREESAGLLQFLYQHIERPEFNCRVRWEPGTLILWNNHQLLHYAVNDYNERRELYRLHFSSEKLKKYTGV
ncbi:TauD/TfdA family dioxygenase [Aquimarina sp. AU58]|uniref:TauD/TfdA dioxygenase family protein n=1 Tax=Aquimarina sp. AU58 TaxID=1874112 RepID=UPI000D64AA52|nr:TauD/TfdA family dioxygenase [Aquimarina sp. AU58]